MNNKPRRNKALSVLDGRIKLAEEAATSLQAQLEAAIKTREELWTAREAVTRAYERPRQTKRQGKPVKSADGQISESTQLAIVSERA